MPDLDEIRESFEFFDGDGDGQIDYMEFRRLLEAMGVDVTEEELDAGFAAVDQDVDGTIGFHEFAQWWMNH